MRGFMAGFYKFLFIGDNRTILPKETTRTLFVEELHRTSGLHINMPNHKQLTEQDIHDLTHRLKSPLFWVRRSAGEELEAIDFAILASPLQLLLLLYALHVDSVRKRAAESLGRIYSNSVYKPLAAPTVEEMELMRDSLLELAALDHAEYLVPLTRVLVQLRDIDLYLD